MDVTGEHEVGVRTPFVFDAETRCLAVLTHSSFTEKTVPRLFEKWLGDGERRRDEQSTEWAVEPILDKQEFYDWIRSDIAVEKVTLVARLPNPSALPEFAPVWDKMQQRKAGLMKQILEAADPSLGLSHLEEDDQIQAFVAMGGEGFGYVFAKGKDGNSTTVSYDSRKKVTKLTTDPLPSQWRDVVTLMWEMARRRRLDEAS